MGRRLDITGERYGKLVALYPTSKYEKSGGISWMFRCDCGNLKECSTNSVRRGLIKSCGCLHKPHGESKTRLHRIWCGMRERCRIDNTGFHKNWAGRGIKVCDEWNRYPLFKEWALSHGYTDDLTIDRIDNNGDYEPANCRWISYREQLRNTRTNHYVTINGESHIVPDWCEILQTVTPSTVYQRVKKYGWTFEKALTTPSHRGKRWRLENARKNKSLSDQQGDESKGI